MLSSIIGKYYEVPSSIHQLHPVTKLVSCFLFFLLSWWSDSLLIHSILIIVTFFLLLESKVPSSLYLKPLWQMKYFFLIFLCFPLMFKMKFLTTLLSILRVIELVLYTTMITLTTKQMDLIYGFQRLLSPLRTIFPIDELAFLLSLTLQFLPTIIEEANKLLKSLASRGLDYETAPILKRVSILKGIFLPMFFNSIKRADAIAEVMELRGYDPKRPRTNLKKYYFHLFDVIFLTSHILLWIGGIVCAIY